MRRPRLRVGPQKRGEPRGYQKVPLPTRSRSSPGSGATPRPVNLASKERSFLQAYREPWIRKTGHGPNQAGNECVHPPLILIRRTPPKARGDPSAAVDPDPRGQRVLGPGSTTPAVLGPACGRGPTHPRVRQDEGRGPTRRREVRGVGSSATNSLNRRNRPPRTCKSEPSTRKGP